MPHKQPIKSTDQRRQKGAPEIKPFRAKKMKATAVTPVQSVFNDRRNSNG